MAGIPPLSLPSIAADAFDGGRIANRPAAPSQAAPAANVPKTAEAFRQFEAFVLQSFIETMLPKNAESVFGKGTAGAVWKSMLAEKLADQISRSGGIGIAERIAAGPQVPPANGDAARSAAGMTAMSVSLQPIREQRGDDA